MSGPNVKILQIPNPAKSHMDSGSLVSATPIHLDRGSDTPRTSTEIVGAMGKSGGRCFGNPNPGAYTGRISTKIAEISSNQGALESKNRSRNIYCANSNPKSHMAPGTLEVSTSGTPNRDILTDPAPSVFARSVGNLASAKSRIEIALEIGS